MKPELTNERARREWQYIVDRVGEGRALAAIGRLKGNQRPYPLNIARVLRIKLPEEAYLPVLHEKREVRRQQAAKGISDLRKALK